MQEELGCRFFSVVIERSEPGFLLHSRSCFLTLYFTASASLSEDALFSDAGSLPFVCTTVTSSICPSWLLLSFPPLSFRLLNYAPISLAPQGSAVPVRTLYKAISTHSQIYTLGFISQTHMNISDYLA